MADLCADCGNPIDWANRKWTICGKCKGAKIRKTLQEKSDRMTPEERAAEGELLRLRGQRGLATKRLKGLVSGDARQSPRQPAVTEGYVYLLQSPTQAYKIGRSRFPEDRLRTFGIRLPFEVEFVVVIRTDNMQRLESTLHARFAHRRVTGEWFNLAPEDIEYIKGLVS